MFSPTREMLNLPDDLYEDYTQPHHTPWSFLSSPVASSSSAPDRDFDPVIAPPPNVDTILQWIDDLTSSQYNDVALQSLVKYRNKIEILPVLVWDSIGTVHCLLQEVTDVYKSISAPIFSSYMALRVYNIFLLFQSIAHHPETRGQFLEAYAGCAAAMPYYFFPFMNLGYTDKARECLRLGALGVIAHLLKAPVDEAAARFLMDTGAFRYCIRPIEIGSTESKILAVFILQKLMSTEEGLKYCCILVDRFYVIADLLRKVLVYISVMPTPSSCLFNLVVACYARLSQTYRAREGIRRFTPIMLLNGTFAYLLAEDPVADNNCKELIENLQCDS